MLAANLKIGSIVMARLSRVVALGCIIMRNVGDECHRRRAAEVDVEIQFGSRLLDTLFSAIESADGGWSGRIGREMMNRRLSLELEGFKRSWRNILILFWIVFGLDFDIKNG